MPMEGETQDSVTASWSGATPHRRLDLRTLTTELRFYLSRRGHIMLCRIWLPIPGFGRLVPLWS